MDRRRLSGASGAATPSWPIFEALRRRHGVPLRPTLTLALALVPLAVAAEEAVDLDMLTRIRAEGFHHSGVMETVAQLTDVIGPRLTNSPLARRANESTRQQLEAWALVGAHLGCSGPCGPGSCPD